MNFSKCKFRTVFTFPSLIDNAAGCVVNTCGWVDGGGYKVLLHAAKELAGELDSTLQPQET